METILLTGGIGDIFALDGFWSKKQKNEIKHIILATPQADIIESLFKDNVFYPSLESIEIVSKSVHFEVSSVPGLENYKEIEDCSILIKFPLYRKQYNEYQFSSLIHPSKIRLNQAIIVPDSTNYYIGRDYDTQDWLKTVQILHQTNLTGIVLNPCCKVPRHPLLKVVHNDTMLESVKMLNESSAYIGIDSCLSVLASRSKINCIVKSINPHCFNWRDMYYDDSTEIVSRIGQSLIFHSNK